MPSLTNFLELFMDTPGSPLGVWAKAGAQWTQGVAATTSVAGWTTVLGQKAKVGTNPDYDVMYSDVRLMELRLFIPLAAAQRAARRALGVEPDIRGSTINSETVKNTPPIAARLNEFLSGTFSVEPVLTLWVNFGAQPDSTAYLHRTWGIWGYVPTHPEIAPPNLPQSRSAQPLNSQTLGTTLSDDYDRLINWSLVYIGYAVGLPLLVATPRDIDPAAYYSARLTPPVADTLSTLRQANHDEFCGLLQTALKGGDTSAAEVEGRHLLFRQQTYDPASKRSRSFGFFVPLTSSPSASARPPQYERSLTHFCDGLSYQEAWIASGASAADAGLSKTIEGLNKIFPPKRRDSYQYWAKRAEALENSRLVYEGLLQSARDALTKFSFDSVPDFPSARESILGEGVAVQEFHKTIREGVIEAHRKMEELLSRDNYRAALGVNLLTVLLVVGSFLIGIVPLLVENNFNLNISQWSFISVLSAAWFGSTGAMIFYLRRRA